jgi:hypothetical protein
VKASRSSNDSINDQPNDNGPNASLREKYNVRYNQWRASHPCVPYDTVFFNEVFTLAWDDFVKHPGTPALVIKAFRKTRIFPLVDVLDESTVETETDKRNAKMASLFATDDLDKATLRIYSDQEVAKATVRRLLSCIITNTNIVTSLSIK